MQDIQYGELRVCTLPHKSTVQRHAMHATIWIRSSLSGGGGYVSCCGCTASRKAWVYSHEGLAPKKKDPPPAKVLVSSKNCSRFEIHCGNRVPRNSSCCSGLCFLASYASLPAPPTHPQSSSQCTRRLAARWHVAVPSHISAALRASCKQLP